MAAFLCERNGMVKRMFTSRCVRDVLPEHAGLDDFLSVLYQPALILSVRKKPPYLHDWGILLLINHYIMIVKLSTWMR